MSKTVKLDWDEAKEIADVLTKTENPDEDYSITENALADKWSISLDDFHKEDIVVPLKRYEKTKLALELDKEFGFKHRTIYEDIEQTYYDTIYKYGQTNIKIKTNLIPPQKYKFAAEEVEIVW